MPLRNSPKNRFEFLKSLTLPPGLGFALAAAETRACQTLGFRKFLAWTTRGEGIRDFDDSSLSFGWLSVSPCGLLMNTDIHWRHTEGFTCFKNSWRHQNGCSGWSSCYFQRFPQPGLVQRRWSLHVLGPPNRTCRKDGARQCGVLFLNP